MDKITSNPYFNPAQLYQQHKVQQPPPQAAEKQETPAVAPVEAGSKGQGGNFSNMFRDDDLMKLQDNLEAIAKMAESALKRFDS